MIVLQHIYYTSNVIYSVLISNSKYSMWMTMLHQVAYHPHLRYDKISSVCRCVVGGEFVVLEQTLEHHL